MIFFPITHNITCTVFWINNSDFSSFKYKTDYRIIFLDCLVFHFVLLTPVLILASFFQFPFDAPYLFCNPLLLFYALLIVLTLLNIPGLCFGYFWIFWV